MQLFYSPTSPFVRKVMIVLHETDQLDAVTLQSVTTTPLTPSQPLGAANPMAKLPTLMRADGPALYDSRVICEYLNTRAEGVLYNRGWDSKILEATGDGIAEAAVLMSYETRLRPADMVWPDWLSAQADKVNAACDTLQSRWMSHLQGPLDIGQVSVACALAYVDFRHPSVSWRKEFSALADWCDEFAERPSMQATQFT